MTHRKHYKTILKDMGLYGIFGSSARLGSLLLLPFLTRLFTTKEYGAVDIVTVSSGFALTAMTLCIPSAIFRFFYEKSDDERKEMFFSLLMFCSFLAVALAVLLALLTPFLIEITVRNSCFIYYFRLGWVFAAISAPLAIISALLKVDRQIVKYGVLGLTQLILQVVLAVFLAGSLKMGVGGIFWASIVASFLALVLGMVFTRKWFGTSFSWKVCRESLSYSIPMVPSVFTGQINRYGTRFLIILYLTLSDVGVYGVGFLLAGGVSFIITAFQNTWNAYVMLLLKHESFNDINNRVLTLYIGGLVILAFPLLTVMREVCVVFLNPEYIAVLPLMPWLIGGVILQGSGNITSIGIAIKKRTIVNSIVAWVGVSVNILISLLLIPVVGLQGAAIGFFCAQLVFTLLLTFSTYRMHVLRFEHKTIFILLAFYILWSQLILWLDSHLDGFILRYFAGLFGMVVVACYLNIWRRLFPELKSLFNKYFLSSQTHSSS